MPPSRTHGSVTRWRREALRPAAVFLLYLLIAVVYTRPLLWHLGTGLPSDAGDPGLNASVLSWSAATVPFSSAWWNAPQYYPTLGIAAFTENLVGFSPFSSPIIWLTGNSVTGYDVAIFLTWPLSAFAGYLLVARLTRRQDAAFIAGLALAFNPFRRYETSHIQSLATEWLPLMLLGMHGFLDDRRFRWLWLVAVAWVLNSLSNGHFMLFGAVLIGLWLAYFGSRRDTWRAAAALAATWCVASVPLIPIFLKYQAIHDRFNLHRVESEIIFYSAQPASWARISHDIWLWGKFLPDGKDDFFPGATVLVLVVAGVVVLLRRGRDPAAHATRLRRRVRAALMVGLALGVAFTVMALCWGQWDWYVGDVRLFRMLSLNRAVGTIALCGISLVAMTKSLREALARRSPFVFYVAALFICAILACGPMLRVGEEVILSPMPYRWLMALPGFDELRVPARMWMLGVICLSTAAGLAYSHLRASSRPLVFMIVVGAVLLDSWIPVMPIAEAADLWPVVEAPTRTEPLLELPIGPNDYAATFRTGEHGRRLVNGVSGYNPPYYLALVEGLDRRDPRTLAAIASFGPLDVVITEADDPTGEIRRYVSEYPGAEQIATDGRHVAFRVPRGPQEPTLGPALPIASVRVRGGADVVAQVHDGSMETGWGETPQEPDQSVLIDLGTVREVGGVTHAIGDYYLDFPRHLAIDVSVNGSDWTNVWDSPTMGPMVLAWVRAPRVADMRIPFPAHPARYVRIRQTERHFRMWRISEVDVHAPAR